MERFGRGIWGCRGKMMMPFSFCLLLATLCLLQQTRAYNIIPRILITENKMTLVGGEYFVFYGWSVRINCYCTGNQDGDGEVRRVELRLGRNTVNTSGSDACIAENPLELYIANVTETNEGNYECITELRNGTISRTPAGLLRAINPNIIDVPQNQFGLLNSEAALKCSVNSTSHFTIHWSRSSNSDSLSSGRIPNVELDNEGQYMCEVIIRGLAMTKTVNFTVIVPPRFTSNMSTVNVFKLNRNENLSLAVNFESKMSNQTHISWYKNNISLQDTIPERHDIRSEPLNSQTALIFEPIRRSHKGQYRVVIENTHYIIPPGRRFVEKYFTVDVSIPPAAPTALIARRITSKTASLTWSLLNMTSDDSADNQTARISYDENGSLAVNRQVNGEVRELQLSLIPGHIYLAEISAHNQDGMTVSEEYSFQTLPGASLVSAVEVRRIEERNNTIHIIARLAYTGGGTISYFNISFRYIGGSTWVPLDRALLTAMAVDDSQLIWTTEVSDDRFQKSGVEMQVAVVNSNGFTSNTVEKLEDIVVPGAPESVVFVSSDLDSVVLRLVLSTVGTAPLTHLELEILSPEYRVLNVTEHVLVLGGTLDVTLSGLEDGTTYVVSVAVHNYGGKGVPSQLLQVNTVSSPPLAVHGIALVSVGVAILLVTIVIIVAIIWSRYYTMKNRERAYSVAQAESQSNHKLVKQQSIGSAVSPLSTSPSPATPSTATSILTPLPSAPAFCPAPPYCSASSSFLPSNTACHMTSGNLPPASFKFDTGSSRSTSVNQDSDLSESNSPRYTYTFQHAGEGSPHVTSSYEQVDVDLPLDCVEPLEGTVRGEGTFPRAQYSGRPLRKVSAGSHHKMASYTDIDSPQLRTQSNHSVATVQTRLTSSDSSTRESLAYPPIESNTTNV